jgi:hypothetical protein
VRSFSFFNRSAVIALAIAATAAFASAAITGFGDGSNYTLNGYDADGLGNVTSSDPAVITAGVLHITGDVVGEARSAFYNTPQSLSSFVATFTFQNVNTPDSTLGAADGFTFVVQNQGLNAIGGQAADLGLNANSAAPGSPYATIVPGAAEEFFLRNGSGATQFSVNGSGTFDAATSTAPVDLADGDPIQVTLAYNSTLLTLTETLLDLTTADTYSLTRSADISFVGPTGYVGFTGSTGAAFSDQQISNFTFVSVPEPASLSLLSLLSLPLLSRRRQA